MLKMNDLRTSVRMGVWTLLSTFLFYSGETFAGGESGISAPETVCTPKAVGISVDVNVYEPHLLAGTMAHMIGHNIGMGHDDGRKLQMLFSLRPFTLMFAFFFLCVCACLKCL